MEVDDIRRFYFCFEPPNCSHLCFLPPLRGYMYAGLEFGAECYCGHRVQSNKSSESECRMNCTGNPSLVCGGASRLSVFRLKLSQESARRREFDAAPQPEPLTPDTRGSAGGAATC